PMRAGWPSVTAAAVSVARGVGVPGLPRDAWASRLLPAPLSTLVRLGARPGARDLARLASFGTVDHMALRTAALDAALLESAPEQLVILGAGLDARALRLPGLADTPVFEVDHPDTQRSKRAALRDVPPTLHFVGVDFARDDLGLALERAGHDATRSTFFLWEGVTMYLPAAAAEATMKVVRERATRGSVLGFTYVIPELMPGLPPALQRAAHLGFRALGEEVVGAMSEPQAHALAKRAGFVVLHDTSNVEWASTFGRPWFPCVFYSGERLLVARRE
ncbi:MAG: SAM-dependent methyltransferase, partial [Deltaproteobacteria bacterium]|nr:SAM-dependent methyltransferase [Deltaproteobacteria bacterium]